MQQYLQGISIKIYTPLKRWIAMMDGNELPKAIILMALSALNQRAGFMKQDLGQL